MKDHRLLRYQFDDTGENTDNYVLDERHTLIDKRYRCIAPRAGSFYAESMHIEEKDSKRVLIRNVDYCFADLDQSLTLELNKEVAGIVIITNRDITPEVSISYQAVGGYDGSHSTKTLLSLLEKTQDPEISRKFDDIYNKPSYFTPLPHMHSLADVKGLEVLLWHIERIYYALYWARSEVTERLVRYVVDELDILTAKAIRLVSDGYLKRLLQYKKNFTKGFVGLDKVANLPIATGLEAKQMFAEDAIRPSIYHDKYVTTKALADVKSLIYSDLVSKSDTKLGMQYGSLVEPKLKAVSNIPLGSTFVMDSLQNVKNRKVEYDPTVYPTQSHPESKWSFLKLVQKPGAKGSIQLVTNTTTGELYTADFKVALDGSVSVTYHKHLRDLDAQPIIEKLLKHISAGGKAHKDTKAGIGLGDVENLPVATKEQVLCGGASRSYITYTGLLLFAKALITGTKSEEDAQVDENHPSVMEKFQTVFAPCGPCGSLKVVERLVDKPPVYDAEGKIYFYFCDKNYTRKVMKADGKGGFKEEVVEQNSVACGYNQNSNPNPGKDKLIRFRCSGTTKIGIYSDGSGSEYEKVIEQDSTDCGYNPYPARGILIRYECDAFTKVGVYTDGKGGEYKQDTELNSKYCGYKDPNQPAPQPGPNPPVTNSSMKLGFISDSVMNYKKVLGFTDLGQGYRVERYYQANIAGNAPLIMGYNDFPMDVFNPKSYYFPAIYEMYSPDWSSMNADMSLNTQMAFNPTEGEWAEDLEVITEPGFEPPKADKYYPDTIKTIGGYVHEVEYTDAQAAIMQKLLVARVKAVRHGTWGGVVHVKNPNINSVVEYLNHKLRGANLTDKSRQELEATGVLELTNDELKLFDIRNNAAHLDFIATFPEIMLTFPVGSVRLVVRRKHDSRIFGWLRYFQYSTSFSSLSGLPPIPSEAIDRAHEYTPLPFAGFGKWYNNKQEDDLDYSYANGSKPFYMRSDTSLAEYIAQLPYYKVV